MNSTHGARETVTDPDRPVPGRPPLHIADFALPVGIGLWALGVSQTDVTTVGPYGLPAALPIVFYAGLALLVVSAATELARARPSGWRMSVHAVALVVMLYGTAPLVYSQGRYSWLYKTVGVVQYVNAHGHLARGIDIYQNWPGFFALAAWFGKVAGVTSPLAYAKWAQLVFEVAALPLLYLIYDALSLNSRQLWLALLLFSASNWIGQDYLSPQALGTLLSLGIMALAMRWLYLGAPPGDDRSLRAFQVTPAGPGAPGHPPSRVRRPVLICAIVVGAYFVLTFTHELSPYILAVQLGALAVAGLLRPRWLPVALAAIAVGYLLPRFAFVNSHYGLLKSIGNFFSNALPPAFVAGHATGSEQFIERCAEALSAGMWGLAVLGVWLRRRSGRRVVALALLAFTPVFVLALQAYGQEGILRVYLFSLPWTAALAALALVPTAATEDRTVEGGTSRTGRARLWPPRLAWNGLRAPLVLGAAIALFLPAFFGDDSFNAMTKTEVATVAAFLRNAAPGPVYSAIDNAPLADTGKYNLFPLTRIFGSYSLMKTAPVTPGIAGRIAADALHQTHGREPAYVVVTPSMVAYNQAYGVTPSGSFTILLDALAHSRAWKLIVHQAGTTIYELPPTVTTASSRSPASSAGQ